MKGTVDKKTCYFICMLKFRRVGFLFFVVFSMAVNSAWSSKSTSNKKVKAEIISVSAQVFDRQKAQLVDLGKESDPYGMHSDLLITVQLKVPEPNKPIDVKLIATTSATYDESRGKVLATKQQRSKNIYAAPDPEVSKTLTVPFILNYVCNPMTLKVAIPQFKLTKIKKLQTGCAE